MCHYSYKILLIEDRQNWQNVILDILTLPTYEVQVVDSYREARACIQNAFDLILIDLCLSEGGYEGVAILEDLVALQITTPRIVLSAYVQNALDMFMKFKVHDVVFKTTTFNKNDFRVVVNRVLHSTNAHMFEGMNTFQLPEPKYVTSTEDRNDIFTEVDFAITQQKLSQKQRIILRSLRDLLAQLYSDIASIRRIVDDSDLNLGKIFFHTAPINCWHAILREALHRNALTTLLDLVEVEYPNHASFFSKVRTLFPKQLP